MRERRPASPLLQSPRFRLAFRGEGGNAPRGDPRYIGRETEDNIDQRL
jgi:hypothetical protein